MDFFITFISEANFVLAPIFFILIRAFAIIFPPIPGIVLDFAGLEFFGAGFGFVWGEIGVMLGASLSFLIARYFREFLPQKFISKLEQAELKIPIKGKFIGLIILRLFSNPLFDIISYFLGLTKISLRLFLFTSFIGTAPQMFIFYYFGGYFFEKSLIWGISFCVVFAFIIFIITRIYFSKKSKEGTKTETSWVSKKTGKEVRAFFEETDDFSALPATKVMSVCAFCFYDNKFVIVKNGDRWEPVAGHIEAGETPEQALIREIKEESNMKVLKIFPIGYLYTYGEDIYQTRYLCLVEPYGPFVADPDHEVSEIKLVSALDLLKQIDWRDSAQLMIDRCEKILINRKEDKYLTR